MTESPKKLYLLFFLFSLLLTVVFLQGLNWFTAGHPAFPTDDSYIYCQYAKQLVTGHPFQYNTGDAPTTGMTSYPFWLLLSFGYLIGFRGEAVVYFGFLTGFVCLFLSALLVYKIGEIMAGRAAGVASAAFLCINGQVLWGYFSGLEIAVFSTLLLVVILSFIRDRERKTIAGTMVACSFLAVARPEGLVLGCFIAILSLISNRMKKDDEGSPFKLKGGAWVLLPFGASIAYLALNKVIGGHLAPTSGSSKSLWVMPDATAMIYIAAHFIIDAIKGIFGGSYPSNAAIGFSSVSPVAYFAPLALLFFLFGSFPGAVKELRSRQISGFTVLLSSFIIGLGFVAFASSTGWQHHRYLIPLYPLFVICMVMGIFSCSSALAPKMDERAVRTGIIAFFATLSLVTLGIAFCEYVFEGELVRSGVIDSAQWVNENLKDDDVLGLIDAGAFSYFGQRKTVDLLGLTTARFYGKYRNGWGAAVAELAHMSEEERPSYFALMPLFALQTQGMEPLYQVLGRKAYEPPPLYLNGETIFEADYAALDAARKPLSDVEGWTMVDSLDVGYISDEKRCGYSVLFSRPAMALDVGLHIATYGDSRKVADSGRIVIGGETFTIKTEPNKPLRMVLRSSSTFRTFRFSPFGGSYITSSTPFFVPVAVSCNGLKLEGAGIKTLQGDMWSETVLDIPSAAIRSNKTTIEIAGSYNSFRYWFYQK
jgi:hypothetical protein